MQWHVDIVEDRPNELIRWRSLPDNDVHHACMVRFARSPGGRGTEVQVRILYRPPRGNIVAVPLYPIARQVLKEEMRRLKEAFDPNGILEPGRSVV